MRNNNIHQTFIVNILQKSKWILTIILLMFMSSCGILEGIFQFGMGLGILISVAVVALVIYIVARMSRKKRS